MRYYVAAVSPCGTVGTRSCPMSRATLTLRAGLAALVGILVVGVIGPTEAKQREVVAPAPTHPTNNAGCVGGFFGGGNRPRQVSTPHHAPSDPPQREGKKGHGDAGQRGNGAVVYAGGGMQFQPNDRFDEEGAFFVKGLIGIVALAGMFAILKRICRPD